MFRKALLTVVFIATCICVFAKFSDDFLLGNYSYWRTYDANADSVFKYMQSSLYNNTICNALTGEESSLTTMLNKLNAKGLDATLIDYSWDLQSSSNVKGTHNYTSSNYQLFEAEYSDESSVNGDDRTDDKLYYACRPGSDNRVGTMQHGDKSNGAYWNCEAGVHQPGYAYNYQTYRWHDEDNDTEPLNEVFQIAQLQSPADNLQMLNNSYLIFTFAFDFPDLPRIEENPIDLLTFDIGGIIDGSFVAVPHWYTNKDDEHLATTLTDSYYNYLSEWDYTNRIFTVHVTLQRLLDAGLLSSRYGKYSVMSLYPRIYWHGSYTLRLDYIYVEDSVHKLLRTAPQITSANINNRINHLQQLASNNNLKYLYSFDEPNQAQFDSYKLVKQQINTNSPTIVTAMWSICNNLVKNPGGTYPVLDNYNITKAFIDVASPKVFMPDIYPILPNTNWNTASNNHFVQKRLDNMMLQRYKWFKQQCMSNPDMKFVPVVQSFGDMDATGSFWCSWLRPPRETQKMLQLLPMCYGADGIIDYRFQYAADADGVIRNPNDMQYSTLGIRGTGASQTFYKEQNYYAIHEANAKIKAYASILSPSTWMGADCLRVGTCNTDIPLSNLMVQQTYIQQAAPANGHYEGYVQCGAYLRGSDPYFMLVNRRANYCNPNTNPANASNANLDNCFTAAQPQTVRFYPNSTAYTHYGTNISFHDPFDDSLYPVVNTKVDIPINAGDGRLLHIVGSLPNTINAYTTLSNQAIISGNITLANGANVAVTPGTVLRIMKNSMIIIMNGATFSLRDSVVVEDSVRIVVNQGGMINFNNAHCYWGKSSGIETQGGQLNIVQSTFDELGLNRPWDGIRATDGASVTITNSVIRNAMENSLNDTDLALLESSIVVPEYGTGLSLYNVTSGHNTNIYNSGSENGFYGLSNQSSRGIIIRSMANRVYIHNVYFQNLATGIFAIFNTALRDSISNCHFINCQEGFFAIGAGYYPHLVQCSFYNNGIGICINAATPYVYDCDFTNCIKGILTEFSLFTIGFSNGIYNSAFDNCTYGIESRNSNIRVEGNTFDRNQVGVYNHTDSNLNLSYSALNLFMNTLSNIGFSGTQPYYSNIQLYKGHNDFYHLGSSYDFSFDGNYLQNPNNKHIDVSMNWFQDGQIRLNDNQYSDYIQATSLDPSFNIPSPPPENDRFYTALYFESQQQYNEAKDIYKAIIDDGLETEKCHVSSAIDGLYRIDHLVTSPDWNLTEFFNAQSIQYSIDDPQLSAIFNDYLVKGYVGSKNYQSAVNLIQSRIDCPLSQVDSLLAVLDLEIVLQIAAMDESKQVLNTKYTQYRYSDVQSYSLNHSRHVKDLYDAEQKGISDGCGIVLPTPRISSNYPNPFNPTTTISFSLPFRSKAEVAVFNTKGQKVKDLLESTLNAGIHRIVWDGTDNQNKSMASGIYFVRLNADGESDIRNIMLIK